MSDRNQPKRSSRVCFCSVVLALTLVVSATAHAATGLPETTFAQDLNGKQLDPFSVSGGRVVVLVFIRTDCPISNRYAPLLQKLSDKLRGKVDFWLVYPNRTETPSQIKTYLQDFHYSIPALRDTEHALVKRSQTSITPEAAVFSSSGRLLYHGRIDNWYEDFGRARAAATTHELEDAISAALAGKAPALNHANAVGCYIADLK
jgi:thiol-disulfide isomerase/thioredoxin